MNLVFWIGIGGAIILVAGSAWPDTKSKPYTSIRNWLLALGGLFLLVYAWLNYLNGGSVFFVFLEGLINVASICMMLGTREKVSTSLISVLAFLLILWSLSIFEGYDTLFFILGLSGISLGYVLKPQTARRNLSLMLGSILVALFSFFEASWIFFWLNVFFAIFSGYYAWKWRRKGKGNIKY